MVLYIRLLSHDAEDFVMELAVDSTAAFMALHLFIQNSLGYDPSNMASFVITDNDWNRLKEISLMKMNEEDEGVELMADTRIGDLLSDVKQRALYVFDFFSERAFFIEVFDIKPGELKEPMLIKLEGKIPSQINIDDNLVDDDLDDILDDDEFGEGFEDIDDIDPDSIPDGY
jgi:hypothetical protein